MTIRGLAFSAILALGALQGWNRLNEPNGPSFLGTPDRVTGKADKTGDARPKAAPGQTEQEETGSNSKPAGRPQKPANRPAQKEPEKEKAPAREDRSDCDDCVIVREGSGEPEGNRTGAGGMAGSALAGTLWGLFLAARPKRMRRTIIRGITVS